MRKPHIDLKNVLEILKKRVKNNCTGDKMNSSLYATREEAESIKSLRLRLRCDLRLRLQKEPFHKIIADKIDGI